MEIPLSADDTLKVPSVNSNNDLSHSSQTIVKTSTQLGANDPIPTVQVPHSSVNQTIAQTSDLNVEESTSTGVFLAKKKKLFEAQEALERQREIYKKLIY